MINQANQKIRLSPDAPYLSERNLKSIAGSPVFVGLIQSDAVGSKEAYLSSVAIRMRGREERQLWACRSTGQLFNQESGACLSSSRLHLIKVRPAEEVNFVSRRVHRKKSVGEARS